MEKLTNDFGFNVMEITSIKSPVRIFLYEFGKESNDKPYIFVEKDKFSGNLFKLNIDSCEFNEDIAFSDIEYDFIKKVVLINKDMIIKHWNHEIFDDQIIIEDLINVDFA